MKLFSCASLRGLSSSKVLKNKEKTLSENYLKTSYISEYGIFKLKASHFKINMLMYETN